MHDNVACGRADAVKAIDESGLFVIEALGEVKYEQLASLQDSG